MNLVDIVILVILGIFLLKGVFRGLLREVCSLLGLVCGGLLAFYLHMPVAQWLMEMFHWPAQLCVTLGFLIIFLTTILIFGALGFLLHRFVSLPLLGGVNRLAGAVFGVLQGFLLLSLILFALHAADVPTHVKKELSGSELAPPFATLGKRIFVASRDLALN